jgi:hypothetical protein
MYRDYAIVPLWFFKNRTVTGAVVELFFIFFAFLLGVSPLPLLSYTKSSPSL